MRLLNLVSIANREPIKIRRRRASRELSAIGRTLLRDKFRVLITRLNLRADGTRWAPALRRCKLN